MTLYSVEFVREALTESLRLSLPLRRRLKEDLEFLRAGPFRSHPGVQVKELREARGVWRFHLGKTHRVFYTAVETRLVVVLVERSAAVTSRSLSEIHRRLPSKR